MTKIDEELAQAYINGQRAIDAFNKREAISQSRCRALVRELEWHQEKRLRRLGGLVKAVFDGDFSEAAE